MGPEAAVNIVFRDELAQGRRPGGGARALPGRVPREVRQPVRGGGAGLHRRGDPPARDARPALPRAGGARQQARHEPAEEAREHSAVKPRLVPCPARPRVSVRSLALARRAGCATAPQPVTKIVNGRVIVTRAVSPEAYEHVTRAMLYEEEERWKEAADELQRALPFDPEAAEVRAAAGRAVHPARTASTTPPSRSQRSLAIAPTVDGLPGAARTWPRRATTTAPRRRRSRRCARRARLALDDDDAEAIERDAPRAGRRAGGRAGSVGGAGDGAAAGRRGARDAARPRPAGGAGLGDGRARRGEAALVGRARRSSRPTSRRASCWPSCRSRPATIDAAKAAFRDGDRSRRRAAGRSPTRSRAGWSCAASVAEAQELADRLDRRRRRRRRAGAGERARAHREAARARAWRWPSARRKLGAAGGPARAAAGRARRSRRSDKAGAVAAYLSVGQARPQLLRGAPARRRAAARPGQARRGGAGARRRRRRGRRRPTRPCR